MPYAPKRPCPTPGCHRTIERKEKHCDVHTTAYERERGSSHSRGYGGTGWAKTRLMVLNRDPLCRCPTPGLHKRCCLNHAPANTAAHIVPRTRGGEDTMENLRGLCTPCHGAERERFGRLPR